MMPGLVNAHTHLELTGFGDPVEEDEFPKWIRRVRTLKETRSRDEYLQAAGQGLEACFAAGVTTVAETGDTGVVAEALAGHGGRGVVFQEVFGPHPDQSASAIESVRQRLSALQEWASEAIRIGVSPHAPYTVSGTLYRKVAELGQAAHLPLAVHIAESLAEQEFLATGSGPFRDAWQRRGIPMPDPPGDSPLGWLERHGVLSPGVLCIHAIQCDAADINRLVRHRCTVAHCPRSNRLHGHGDAPLKALLEAGVTVGLGTDSELSLAPMDLLAEARLAGELAGLGADAAVELATLGSARAIGWGDAIGALEAGRWADVVIRRVGDVARVDQLSHTVLQSGPEAVVLTVIAGVDRYRLA
jgi:cytosine/adenosine deaminase-related metal-dependent hydrolase